LSARPKKRRDVTRSLIENGKKPENRNLKEIYVEGSPKDRPKEKTIDSNGCR
jgi:hypothetical protein